MSQEAFHTKWGDIAHGKTGQTDEKSLYVEPGSEPMTQRQLNLWYYFLFIAEKLKEIDARNVIELGCGRGTMALSLAQYCGMQLTLLDNEEDAIAIAKEAFLKHGITATFLTGDALKTHLPNGSFDATVSIGLAEHLDSVDALFAEQYRLLRDGGIMISLNIPKKRSIQELNTVHRFVKKCLGMYKQDVRKDYKRNSLKPEEYAQSALSVGFAAAEVTHVCPFPIYVPVTMKTDKRVTWMRKKILALRSVFMRYPYKTNRIIAQAHFLVAYKAR
jgi:ubiquinone/menaquinone biosynthesis C-methylase UbiE